MQALYDKVQNYSPSKMNEVRLFPFAMIRRILEAAITSGKKVRFLDLVFRYGPQANPCFHTISVPVSTLQHSFSTAKGGSSQKPNYYTLTGLTVSDLAAFLAEEPRVKRRGRYLRAMD
jgi:hypothetical protein